MKYLFRYYNLFEYDKPSDNCLLILVGKNGYDDNVCHYSVKDHYEIKSLMHDIHYSLPYYILNHYIDLNKFKMQPIQPYEKSFNIEHNKYYIIRRGIANYTILCSSGDEFVGGYFTDNHVNAYLPYFTNQQVDTINEKLHEIKRKFEDINKDFE